jgi:hypothetical protein
MFLHWELTDERIEHYSLAQLRLAVRFAAMIQSTADAAALQRK